MRLLHTADWHLGRTLEGRSRIEEQAQFLDELAQIVKEEKIDAILMAGDVFDTVNPPAAAEQLFYESMSKLSEKGNRPIIVIAGNHDNPDRLSAASPLAFEQNITLIGLPTTDVQEIYLPTVEETLKVGALPYPSESRLKEMLAEEDDELLLRNSYDERVREIFLKMSSHFTNDSVNIAMSHIYVAGGSSTDSERPIEVGGAYTVAASSLPAAAQYVALGHLHRPQDIKRASTKARYSGSPLAYSFSESGYTKSVTILDGKPGKEMKVTEIPLSSGRPLTRWRAKNGIAEVYQWLDEGKDSTAWIDLEIHLEDALSLEEIHRLRKLHKGFIHIRPIFKEEETVEVQQEQRNVPVEESFAKFYRKQTGGATPSDELVQLFLSLIHTQEAEEEE
ncbi:exonuclease sbcCD subunit D [Priestia aryabhattai]|uniref:exonuclease SbcCD subunit D C-terminal domain-containing protein n=1 Tax=Bacillaceae TaxID=186817 RepID=UPI000BA13DD7|nr:MULTISPECIES: exonuclease SbcCD subunit D C-terminal domain-containing protein [Bacillaceae]MDT2048155.1 exonuclease SbcCD subunit D C-terminal domain-containing protein [Priestia flexa]OZT11258.1 exonuclease sbcCD subunit D [Priestia aryabhattai]TDB53273.1 exonuclease SbcCD subunit D [Bacillus sp. CBEL-1]USY55759.1 exonuclease SbcCD subunit D C-terminal domain-containing protein [Bacillus sp. 1780r2a1]